MIELHDIDRYDAPAAERAQHTLAGYVHVMPNGSWHAFRISTGYERSGDGSLRALEPGLWVTNMDYERVVVLSREFRHVLLRADGWMKMTSGQILSACGMQDVESRAAARFLAGIVHRLHALSIETLRLWNSSPRAINKAHASFRSKPSLATGIAGAIEAELLRSRPTEKQITSVLTDSYQLGMFCFGRKVPPDGHYNLTFRFPALTYAINLSRQQVPDRATWRIGMRQSSISQNDFIDAVMEMDAPVIMRARCEQVGNLREELDAMTGFNRRSDTYRTLFLLDEIDILRKRAEMSVESVVVGEGWVETVTSRLMEKLIEVCDGRMPAAHSFTVNLLAQNFLSAIFRRAPKDTGPQPTEAIWIAARDRCAMYPVIETFYDLGASLVSAQLGIITIQCPADPEILQSVLDTAWQAGLSLPIGEVLTLTALGVDIPSSRAEFGGNSVDYGLSVIAQTAKKKALLALDEIMDQPAGQRETTFRAMIS